MSSTSDTGSQTAGTSSVLAYATMATASRAVTEAIAPAVLVSALATGHSAGQGAIILAGVTGLAAVGGPFIGATLDRVRHPGRVVSIAIIVLAGGVGLLAWLMPHAPLLALLVIASIGGMAQPALTGGLSSQLPSLVRPDQLTRAYGIDAATYNIGAIAGPPLAAASVIIGPVGPLVFTFGLLLVALAMRPFVPFPTRTEPGIRHSLVRDVTTGFNGLFSTPSLASATLINTIGFLGQAGFLVGVPLLVILQQGSLAHSGWVFGASAIGGVLSSAWIAYRPLKHLDEIIVATTVVVGLALITLAFSPSFFVTILAAFVIGVADGPLLAATFAVRSREAAPEIRSVVFTTAASIKTSLYAIAAAVLGAVSDHGVGFVFGIAALIQVIALICAKVTTTAMLSRANVR
jgi:MFS family permease